MVFDKQSILPREVLDLPTRIRGSAVWTLLRSPLPTAVFHGRRPGHGKAVISSYLIANQETARRCIVLSVASALMRRWSRIAASPVCAWLLNAPPKPFAAPRGVEIASLRLIARSGSGWLDPRAADSCARCSRRGRSFDDGGASSRSRPRHTIMITA